MVNFNSDYPDMANFHADNPEWESLTSDQVEVLMDAYSDAIGKEIYQLCAVFVSAMDTLGMPRSQYDSILRCYIESIAAQE
jgi:hypothetical protein